MILLARPPTPRGRCQMASVQGKYAVVSYEV
jgi:hypothetical protein